MDTLDQLEKIAVQAAIDGEWELAITNNKQIIKLGHKTVAVYNRLAKAYVETKNWEKAIKAFESALKIDPVNNVSLNGLANAKKKKSAGPKDLKVHKTTLLTDANTTHLLELNLKKAQTLDELKLVFKNEKSYILQSSNGKKIKTIARSRLNLKQDAVPSELSVNVVGEVKRGLYSVSIRSTEPVFKAVKQSIDPSIEVKLKEVIAEKKELEKLIDSEREEEE